MSEFKRRRRNLSRQAHLKRIWFLVPLVAVGVLGLMGSMLLVHPLAAGGGSANAMRAAREKKNLQADTQAAEIDTYNYSEYIQCAE